MEFYSISAKSGQKSFKIYVQGCGNAAAFLQQAHCINSNAIVRISLGSLGCYAAFNAL